MTAFRILLIAIVIVMLVYTGVVIAGHGANFVPVYNRDIVAMGWPGQFNMDFTALLLLAALWIAWRNGFSAGGIALALPVLALGAAYLCIYLLVLTGQAKGDMREVLLGGERAAR